MANYSKYNKNGGLNVQNSNIDEYLKNVVNATKKVMDTPVADVVNAAKEAAKTPVGKYDVNSQAINTAQAKAPATYTAKDSNVIDVVAGAAQVNNVPRTNYTNAILAELGDLTKVNNSTGGGGALNAYISELERQRAERQAMLDAQYKQGKQNIENSAADSNRQAYVAYMNGLKNMPQAAAMYGSGGMAQSLANKSQLNYENNRNNIETAKLASLSDLESDYRAGVINAGEDYLSKLANVQQKAITGAGTATDSGSVYKINGLGITATDEAELFRKLVAAGLTQSEAEEYMIEQGVIINGDGTSKGYGTPKR